MFELKKGVYWKELSRLVRKFPFLKDAEVAVIDFDWCLRIDIGDNYDIEIFPEHHISEKRKRYNEVPWRLYLWKKIVIDGSPYRYVYRNVERRECSFDSLSENIEILKYKKKQESETK